MRLSFQELTTQLEWNDSRRINELVVENPKAMRRIIEDISSVANGDVSGASIVDDNTAISPGMLDIIYDPINLDFNDKRIVAPMLKELLETSLNEGYYLSTNEIKTEIIKYMNSIIFARDYDFGISMSDFSITQLAKAVNLRIANDNKIDFVENIISYMKTMTELAGVRMFCFVGLRGYLSDAEYASFTEDVYNLQINILLIEVYERPNVDKTKKTIVDGDLCEI